MTTTAALYDDRPVAEPQPPQTSNKQTSSMRRTLLVLILPSVVLLLLINAYPLIYAGWQSLRNGTLISSGKFVGITNYTRVLTDSAFWEAVSFTVVFTIAGVFGSWLLGLGAALLLRTEFPGRNLFKVLLLLPWVVPVVVSAAAWNWLVATPQSPVPAIFEALGFSQPLFLATPLLAKITVILFEIWLNFPFMMLMNMAALSSIDETVYEAANMDGASGWKQFRFITLPLIARSTYISWILMTIFIVNDFATIYLLTGGGPVNSTTTLVVLSYRTVFTNFQVGPGVAIAFIMTAVLVLISAWLYRMVRKAHV